MNTLEATRPPFRNRWLAVTVLLLASGGMLLAGGRREPEPDAAIAARVRTALGAEVLVDPAKIVVQVTDGIVTLSGVAPTDAARLAAGRVADETRGVRAVRNLVQVSDQDEVRSETTLEGMVLRRLQRAQGLEISDLRVAVDEGVVFLSGTAPDDRTQDRAAALAADVEGVIEVKNLIEVQGR